MATDNSTLSKVLTKNHLELIKHLGSGSFGSVYKIKDTQTGRNYAIKSSNESAASERETLLWGSMKHENVLPLIQVVTVRHWKTLYVMPAMPHSLLQVVCDPGFRARTDALTYARKWLKDILTGLNYLHKNSFAHLDMKTDNILISEDYGQALITDFTFVTNSKIPTLNYGAPSIYLPPEAHPTPPCAVVDPQSFDLWTTGLIAVEIFTNHSILHYNSRPRRTNDWMQHNYPMLSHLLQANTFIANVSAAYPRIALTPAAYSEMRNFLFSLVQIDPDRRSAAELALNHRFLGGSYYRSDSQDFTSQMYSMHFYSSMTEYHIKLYRKMVRDPGLHPNSPDFPSWIMLSKEGDFMQELGPSAPLPRHLHNPFRLPKEHIPGITLVRNVIVFLVTILIRIASSLPGLFLLFLSVIASILMKVSRMIVSFHSSGNALHCMQFIISVALIVLVFFKTCIVLFCNSVYAYLQAAEKKNNFNKMPYDPVTEELCRLFEDQLTIHDVSDGTEK